MKEKEKKILISSELAEKIKEKIKGTEFKSVSEYVSYLLKNALSENTGQEGNLESIEEEEQRVKERLRSLGYLD